MKSWIILLSIVLFMGVQADTDFILKGMITDADTGEPLISATVLLKGTSMGNVTYIDGVFTIPSHDSCHTVVVSYLGFETIESEVCHGTLARIALKAAVTLDEVVVTGLGTRQEKPPHSYDSNVAARRELRGKRISERQSVPAQTVQTLDAAAPPPPPPPAAMMMQKATRPGMLLSPAPEPTNGEGYAKISENDFIPTATEHISTFAIDVDAASYSNVRRFLNEGQLPPADAVRSEEMINYFQYNYPPPADTKHPFQLNTELSACPWNPNSQLLLVGMRAQQMAKEDLPPANFVFLLDVSGSMQGTDRLPLLIESMKLLTDNLRAEDKVAIVVYAGASGLVLEPTSGADKNKIKDALSRLRAGGSTAGAAGIQQAYEVARANFVEGGNNRVILATDGDFNVGVADNGGLEALIVKERESGIFLSVLGFGRGNLQDEKMQLLADKGNGNHAYIDQLSEAKKVLVNEFGGTLFTVAKDVKIQVEFNPDYVAAYRLIGYENRLMANEDFRDDTKDAGELGAGHTITALYEITPNLTAPSTDVCSIVRLRYKAPNGTTAQELSYNVGTRANSFGQSSINLRWAAAVSEFAMLLRDSKHKNTANYTHCQEIARQAMGRDPFGYRKEMVDLITKAESLQTAIAAEK